MVVQFEIKKKHCYIAIILIFFVIISFINIKCLEYNWKEYFRMSLQEILTIIVGSIVIYCLTKKDNKESKLYDKVEKKCEDLKEYIKINLKDIPSMLKEERLLKIRYISNQVSNIERYIDNIDKLSENYRKMKEAFDNLNDFISDNIDQSKEYFDKDNRKIKLERLINNVELRIEDIIIFTYIN
ncbi:unknown [Clostridium sp. CAG:492]|nr:unknown [Clostridium sp. CAG:492]